MIARRTPRGLARALSLVSLTAPLAAVLVAGSAPAALAAVSASWSDPTPSSDAVVTSGSTVSVKASISSGTRYSPGVVLKLTPPGGLSSTNNSMGACQTSLTNSCPGGTLSVSYSLNAAIPNGAWSATVTNGSSSVASRRFFTNMPPTSTPSDVTAKATNPSAGQTVGTVDVSWTYGGSDVDLWGYRVDDGNGWSTDLSASSAGCSGGGTCHVSKQYDNAPGSTTSYSFTVRALRSSCKADGCSVSSDTVAGGASSPASAQLVTPQPPPSPTPSSGGTTGGSTGTTGGTTGGSTGGSATGTSGGTTSGGSTSGGKTSTGSKAGHISLPTLPPVIAQRKAFALSFNSFAPKLGIPKLPPLPATTFPETVGASQDTYQPTLPYKAQPAKTTTSIITSPLSAVADLDTAQLAKSLAVALVLLVAAAHVRLFVKAGHAE